MIRRAVLGEISFVDLGADGRTSARVAASGGKDKEDDMDQATDERDKGPRAAAVPDPIEEIRSKAVEETRRIAAIQRIAHRHAEIAEKAISGGWDEAKTELEVLRAERPAAPAVGGGSGERPSADVLEAAVCLAGKLDGVYEIEVRPSEWFWRECRGHKVVTLVTDPAGGGSPVSGLPLIQNLRREIVGFQSLIRWDVAAEQAPGAFEFGLWFGPTSPVDTSGPPAQTVPYVAGEGDYQAVRAQTAAEYVAVVAFTTSERGDVAELFLPWETVASDSPSNQFAQFSIGR